MSDGTERAVTLEPEKGVRRLNSGGWTFRRAEVDPDYTVEGGAGTATVSIETHPTWGGSTERRLAVAIGLEQRDGPEQASHDLGFHKSEDVMLYAADLPRFIASLVRAAYIAERDGVVPPFKPDCHAMLAALNAIVEDGEG